MTWAIEEMISSLKQVTVKSSRPAVVDFDLAKSFNLRLLIHYVGDIHQPLHAVTRFDQRNPSGDEGGNHFPISDVEGVRNLHMLWDSVLTKFGTDLSLPLNQSDFEFLTDHASRLMQAYPPESI